MTSPSLEDAAHELARMSILLADALEAGDLAAAERIADERAMLLDRYASIEWPGAGQTEELARLGSLITHAERRGHRVLDSELDALRKQLTVLVEANRAMARYHSSEPLDAGFVDRRD